MGNNYFESVWNDIQNFFTNLIHNPIEMILYFLTFAVTILLSLILHECAHGYVALKCGDPTAKMLGRLTLDPRKHLDPIGTICMVFLRFGWAKPVPINPRNFRNYRRDYILVSLAGIITNLLVCVISLLFAAILTRQIWIPEMIDIAASNNQKNYLLDIYIGALPNAVYQGEFGTVEMFANGTALMYVQRFFLMMAQMNLGLAIFNLLPVPPLDGFRFMDQFVFKGELRMTQQTMQIIQIGFMALLFFGVLNRLLVTVNSAVFGELCKLFALLI